MSGAATPTPTLRRVRPGDVRALLDLFASPGMQRQADITTLAQATDLTEHLSTASSDGEIFAIDLAGRLIGVVNVSAIETTHHTGWCWYWMHVDHRSRGWTSRATATVAAWALGERGLQRLGLGHRVDNPVSGVIALAAGFVQEGRERGKFLFDGQRVDVLTYGRLVTDPPPAIPALDLDIRALLSFPWVIRVRRGRVGVGSSRRG